MHNPISMEKYIKNTAKYIVLVLCSFMVFSQVFARDSSITESKFIYARDTMPIKNLIVISKEGIDVTNLEHEAFDFIIADTILEIKDLITIYPTSKSTVNKDGRTTVTYTLKSSYLVTAIVVFNWDKQCDYVTLTTIDNVQYKFMSNLIKL